MAEKALLSLKICDSAVGSGHFLVGAGHRLARHLARVRALAQGESEPSPLLYQTALRDVIGHCLYGVDINPMAVELCKVTLWLEAMEPGKPLSFLDHHIRVGNSLLGTTPELIAAGLPDDAFTAIEGDDKKVCAALKRRNRQEREGQQDMLHMMVAEQAAEYNSIEARTRGIDEGPDDTINEIQRKADRFRKVVVSPEYQHAQHVADAWCAAFVWKKQAGAPFDAITTDTIWRLEANPTALTHAQRDEIDRFSRQYQFFHWHLAFPEVFANGGFDCVLGNPPWERVKLQEKEWFAAHGCDDIAHAPSSAARKHLIEQVQINNRWLYGAFLDDVRRSEGDSHLMRKSGLYPLCGRGDINLYAVFAEGMRCRISQHGRVGCVVPSGLATDDTTKVFLQDLMDCRSLDSFFEFENEGFFAGAGQGHMVRFALVTIVGRKHRVAVTKFLMQGKALSELNDADRCFELTADDISLVNPNTQTFPIFRTRRDAEIAKSVYRRIPILVREAPEQNWWGAFYLRLVDYGDHAKELIPLKAALDSKFVKKGWALVDDKGESVLPVFESKLVNQFDIFAAQFSEQGDLQDVSLADKANPNFCQTTRFLVTNAFFHGLMEKYSNFRKKWFLVYRDVTDSRASVRTVVSTAIPLMPASRKLPVLGVASSSPAHLLVADLNSFVLDFVARQKIGGLSLSFFVLKQLPLLQPDRYGAACQWETICSLGNWVAPRVNELVYTNWSLQAFGLDCGHDGPPFRWDAERRFLIRCELDAAFFHLYLPAEASGDPPAPDGSGGAGWRPAEGETAEDLARLKASFPTPRDAVAYIMDTFPIVKRRDIEKHGDYRTKLVILDIYDRMLCAIATGEPYQTLLDPPPADPRCCHPPRQREPAVQMAKVFPFSRIEKPSEAEKYNTCVPILTLKAAAGGFSNWQNVSYDAWAEIGTTQPLRRGMFVAQVDGHSMEPLIPDGAWCLFSRPVLRIRHDMIGVVQARAISDPDTGGNYTIKRMKRLKGITAEETEGYTAVQLEPLNPNYPTKVLQQANDDDLQVVAEFIEVIEH